MGRVRPTLAALREQGRSTESSAALRALMKSLRGDPRRGARELGERVERRLRARRLDARRVARLFVRRGELMARGARHVAGVDEVGVGPLAGPVVAAAVILPETVDLRGLDDSKRLARASRERLCAAVLAQAVAVGIGRVLPVEIDRLNIYHASLEAMRRAVIALAVAPDHLLVDARTVPDVALPQTSIIGGDALDGSIAAASIVAKVHRDEIMRRLSRRYPGYGFEEHMGYPTPAHLAALQRLGPSRVHRRSFAPVAKATL